MHNRYVYEDSQCTINFKLLLLAFVKVGEGGPGGEEGGTSLLHKRDGHGTGIPSLGITNPDFVNIVTRNPSLKPFGIPQTLFGTFSQIVLKRKVL